jgi:hypothetical protein
VGTCSGRAAWVPGLPPSPKSDPIERKVLPETAKAALTLWRNGSNEDVSTPTWPRQRSWLRLRLNPGRRSLKRELVTDWVVHPLKPGFFACSKS